MAALWLGIVGAGGLSGCGGGSSNGLPDTLNRVSAEAAGSNCATGGVRVETGRDTNFDGSLSDAEVTGTQFVCNGSDGAAAHAALVATAAELPGAHCTYGGVQVTSGLDLDDSGALDLAEVTHTTYVCDPRPTAGVTWVETAASAVQAQANIGYMTESSTSVTVTLPANADLVKGDLVAVAGMGIGTWTIAQNDGQSIYGGSLGHIGVSWNPVDSNRSWQSVTSSADGTRMAAVEYGGQIYTSTDSGVTWTPRDLNRLWYTIDSSSDGSRLVAGVPGGQLYTSSDSGLTWTARESARSWYDVSVSADGMTMVAAAGGEQLYVSTDGGVTWAPRDSNRLWFSVAVSADGTRMVASEYGGQVYTSTDRGTNWTPRETNRAWAALASSTDGLKLVAAVFGGQIHTSSDGGLTWFAQASVGNWIGVASSAGGQRLVAIQAGGQIYTSDDGGATWAPRFADHNWSSVCSSADGRQFVAVEHGGQIYRSTPFSTTGTAGGVQGGQYDSLELQYQGDGIFVPISHEGTLTVY